MSSLRSKLKELRELRWEERRKKNKEDLDAMNRSGYSQTERVLGSLEIPPADTVSGNTLPVNSPSSQRVKVITRNPSVSDPVSGKEKFVSSPAVGLGSFSRESLGESLDGGNYANSTNLETTANMSSTQDMVTDSLALHHAKNNADSLISMSPY